MDGVGVKVGTELNGMEGVVKVWLTDLMMRVEVSPCRYWCSGEVTDLLLCPGTCGGFNG